MLTRRKWVGRIGEITHLQYVGNDLHVVAETDDADALKLDFFSVSGRPVIKEQRGSIWRVTKFRLIEVSLVRVPQNEKCVVIERKASDPMRNYIKARVGNTISSSVPSARSSAAYGS